MFVSDFVKGLRSGSFNESLQQRYLISLDEIRAREKCYIDGEESNAIKRDKENEERNESQSVKQPRRDNRNFELPT